MAAKQSVPDKGPFYIRTAEESDRHAKEMKRQALLNRLSEVSNARAMEKKASKRKAPLQTEIISEPVQEDVEIKPLKKTFGTSYKDYQINERLNPPTSTGDFKWSSFMDQVEDSYTFSDSSKRIEGTILSSPIDAATGENIADFITPWVEDEDPYASMFKDEIAMASEILKDLKASSKMAMTRLKSMGERGAGGVTKTYSDLLTAITGIQSSKLSAIDKIASWKLKREELRMKAQKDMPDMGQDVDSIVDNYYSRYVVGGENNYTPTSEQPAHVSNQPLTESTPNATGTQSQPNYTSPDSGDTSRRFNITDPDYYDDQSYEGDTGSADPYGYIRHANDDVEICVEKLPSGNVAFVAIDKNGEYVDDYELPGKMMLESLSISPISKYATDKAGRRYRIIDFETSLDIDDDDEY